MYIYLQIFIASPQYPLAALEWDIYIYMYIHGHVYTLYTDRLVLEGCVWGWSPAHPHPPALVDHVRPYLTIVDHGPPGGAEFEKLIQMKIGRGLTDEEFKRIEQHRSQSRVQNPGQARRAELGGGLYIHMLIYIYICICVYMVRSYQGCTDTKSDPSCRFAH